MTSSEKPLESSFTETLRQLSIETEDQPNEEDNDLSTSLSPIPTTDEPLHLLVLPTEILLVIVGFLDPKFVIGKLSLVCKRFHKLVSQDAIWKMRIKKTYTGQYPVIAVDDGNFDWGQACYQIEKDCSLWSNYKENMDFYSLNCGHIASVDSVCLLQNGDICVSGSRDRTMNVWDLRKLSKTTKAESASVKSIQAHKGWVWSMTSFDNILCSASWDCWLNFWDIEADFKKVGQLRGNSAFLCPVLQKDVVMSGSYDKQIYMYDRRTDALISKLRHHKKPVLCLSADEHYIVSGSEDNTIGVYDRRANRLLKKIKMEAFPMSMSYSNGQLWAGLRNGEINVLDPTYGKFDIVQNYNIGHNGKITGINNNTGCIITAATDKTLKVLSPCHPVSELTTIDEQLQELTDLHYLNGVLACGCSDFTCGIWRPKSF
ncbi:F-box/WD repeat-containing protein 9-like [Antedon mediterranea]|uniref:F-box/WD repeat-containing protein 9-like n=1 Tax=Antedon mediterranea TaxID=105859 RepID=UPI003AF979A3